jgi:uncharacterized protein YkwD
MNALRLAVLTVFLLAVAASSAAPAAQSASNPSERMVTAINKVRAKHGLRALRQAPRLTRSSHRYARHLIRVDSFGHGSSWRATGFRTTGEILAMHSGWSRRPSLPLRQWMHSSAHAGLILHRGFRWIGSSPARGYFNGRPTTIWVAHFGG